jgi:hypothetical protein
MRSIEMDTAEFTAALRKWNDTQDAAYRAAGNIVLFDRHWSTSADFREKCTGVYEDLVYIDWEATDNAIQGNELRGSSGELALLRWAVAVARDPFRLSSLDRVNRGIVLESLAQALGLSR